LNDLLGVGIFNSDGHQWNVQRKLASQIFHVKNFRDFFMDIFREESVLLLLIFEKFAQSGKIFDLYDLFGRFTLDSFARIGFGVELKLLQKYLDGDQSPVPFAVAFDRAQSVTQKRFFNPVWNMTEILDGTKAAFDRDLEEINSFAAKVINDRRSDPEAAEKSDLLSRFLQLDNYSDQQLRDIVMNLIMYAHFAPC
jgi:cytochrome P450